MPTAAASSGPGVKRGPGRPRSEAIDEAILDATVEEYVERGRLGLSMEAIAARAGVAKTTLYRRWASADELALFALRRLAGPRPEPPADASAREQLSWQLDGMRRVWSNPRYAALMRRASADGTAAPDLFRHYRDQLIGPQVAAFNQALHAAIDEGLIRADVNLDWARQLLVAPIMAAALTHKERVSKAQLEFTIDTVLRGLAP
jgi:AcrR family transcriptional regulator